MAAKTKKKHNNEKRKISTWNNSIWKKKGVCMYLWPKNNKHDKNGLL